MMINETNWIEFEAWMDDLSISGYMAEDEADDEAPLCFYNDNGFECGSNINNTKPAGATDSVIANWELLTNWFEVTDIIQYLVDFSNEEKKLMFRTENDFGRMHTIELYINSGRA